MAESFGSMLRDFRERTKDPRRGGKPLTQNRLVEQLRSQSGLDLSPSSVGRWERGEAPFPANQRGLLIHLISILQAYGGIKTADEANNLLETSAYAGLEDAEAVDLFAAEESVNVRQTAQDLTQPDRNWTTPRRF